MNIDMRLQFDFLSINVKKSDKEKTCKYQLERCMNAYFKNQKLRQARKAQNNEGCIMYQLKLPGPRKEMD